MTLDEMDTKYPNGLNDAQITAMAVDYQNRNATIHLKMRCNRPDSTCRDVYSHATLELRKFYYFTVEAPDVDNLSDSRANGITVDALPEDAETFPPFRHLEVELPEGAFCCRFFVHDWNAFIHVAAVDAQLSR